MTADAPFTPIHRKKGLTAREVLGEKQLLYAAQLSDSPTVEWQQLFAQEYKRFVQFKESEVLFESEEDEVTHWVMIIDACIQQTNQRYVETRERRTERLRKATEEVKDL